MGKLKSVEEMFEGRHFSAEVIILCVPWYLRFKLSLRDLVEMMAERGLSVAHTTIMRWVQRYAPEFEERWKRFAQAVGQSWRVDGTYVKIRGEWCYLYRAVDRAVALPQGKGYRAGLVASAKMLPVNARAAMMPSSPGWRRQAVQQLIGEVSGLPLRTPTDPSRAFRVLPHFWC
jgi:DDE domain